MDCAWTSTDDWRCLTVITDVGPQKWPFQLSSTATVQSFKECLPPPMWSIPLYEKRRTRLRIFLLAFDNFCIHRLAHKIKCWKCLTTLSHIHHFCLPVLLIKTYRVQHRNTYIHRIKERVVYVCWIIGSEPLNELKNKLNCQSYHISGIAFRLTKGSSDFFCLISFDRYFNWVLLFLWPTTNPYNQEY